MRRHLQFLISSSRIVISADEDQIEELIYALKELGIAVGEEVRSWCG